MLRKTRLKPRSKKRVAKDWLLGKVKRQLWARCSGRCEVPWCWRQAEDAHHVEKRSQGGTDKIDNLVALCRPCHDSTDYPSGQGRLTIFRWTDSSNSSLYGFSFFILGHYDYGDTNKYELGRLGPFYRGGIDGKR